MKLTIAFLDFCFLIYSQNVAYNFSILDAWYLTKIESEILNFDLRNHFNNRRPRIAISILNNRSKLSYLLQW